jgi:O-antigen ligase
MIFQHVNRSGHLIAAFGFAVAVGMGVLVGWWGLTGAVFGLALMAGVVVFLWPETGFFVATASMAVGQLVRLPISGGENSVIINDALLPVVIVFWTLKRLASRRWPVPATSLTTPVVLLAVVMVLSVVVNRAQYDANELLAGSLYALRWFEYLFVLFMGYDFLRTPDRSRFYLHVLVWIGLVLSGLGFLQLRLFPDFSFMVPQGWDPHIGRLLSTWFDPNFLAGFLAFLTTIVLAIALHQPFLRAKWCWAAIAVMTLAIMFTYSRSGYLALAVGAGLVTLVRSRTLFLLGLVGFIIVVLSVPRIQERVVGIRTIDETAQLRLVSWGNAWSVITDHPVLGVGYNFYRYVQVQYGFLDDSREHSASGSDSSLLTVWVTTGTLGLGVYLWLTGAILREGWRTWRSPRLPAVWRGTGLGLLAGYLALLVHSQFVNSLLYPHIMQVVWLCTAMTVMARQHGDGVVNAVLKRP